MDEGINTGWMDVLEGGLPGLTPDRGAAVLREARSSGRSPKQVLVEMGLMTEEELLKALAERLDMGFKDLTPEQVSAQAVAEVPAGIVERYGVIPLAVSDGCLTVAVDDPFDYELIDELSLVLESRVEPVLATRPAIAKAAKTHYGVGAETIERLIDEESDLLAVEPVAPEERDLAEESEAQQASVIKLVNQILFDAIHERATDVHLEPYEDELRVRYRVDGVLREAGVPPAARHFRAAIVSRIKIMSGLDIAEKRLPQDGRAQVRLGEEEFDLRISILSVTHGEAVNIRILPRRPIFDDLPSLGMQGATLEGVERLLERPHGILLVTGPTGSGKTTSLYACLNRLNKPQTKILTIEDPVEYHIRGIQQMQVAPGIGFNFARALRSMLRHDPDIMLVGEIRDAETAQVTIRSALTGHLVFSTLHTNDAAGAVTRLLDMGVESFLISSSVIGVVAQRLVRTICPRCKEPYSPDEALVEGLGLSDHGEDLTLYRGGGCEYCRFTGYRGRTAIFELMRMTDTIRELTLERRPATEIKKRARAEGMTTLREAGWRKATDGITTVEEVLRVTEDEEP